jgi:lactoylglutathione lyase
MLSHVYVGINNFDETLPFYSALMAVLGARQRFIDTTGRGRHGSRPKAALFIIGAPYDNQPAACGNGQMLALLATSREMVDSAYAREHGGVCEGAPGLRPQYHANYYGAYFRDPEGISCASYAMTHSRIELSQGLFGRFFRRQPFVELIGEPLDLFFNVFLRLLLRGAALHQNPSTSIHQLISSRVSGSSSSFSLP